ncbi:MAG: hypothetical protein PHF05_03640 [Candidatus Izemoplasmatales bacterium]|nr:hypothetical protein [Candidatus Izemoplasmatales bacterium]MDD4069525.1 hypothetical protein [Candidatus Izemoplasmatales bacterium]MDY0138643.1 hypothetical protein [Candidatus Izemoplasmatales bacterium]
MPAFYIITKDGFLKKYYTGQELLSNETNTSQPLFSDFLRKALVFNSVLEASNTIINNKLINCFVINQYGQIEN